MVGNGRDALLEGQETLQEGREWSGGPTGRQRVVVRPSRMAGSGQEAPQEGCERSKGFSGGAGVVGNGRDALPKGPGVVGSPSRRAANGRKALPEGRKWSGDFPRGPGVVGRPSWVARHSREALPKG